MNSQATVPNPITSKRHLPLIAHHFDGHPLLNGIITASLAIERNDLEEANKRVAQLHSLTDGILNTGHYATVEDKYRLLYSFVCLLRAYLHLTQSDFKRALGACDEGLLKGNDLEDGTLAKLATFICQKHLAVPAPLLDISEPCKECPKALPNSQPIPCCHLPTMEKFYNEFFKANRPVVIRGMVAQWPAYRKWSFDFLNELCGHRMVPVELGLKYTDVEWNQVLMTFHEYLSQYVRTIERKARPGYLAQHRLADQVPELLSDIITPDYCAFAENGMAEDEQTVNVFIGPGGTVSPLHTDPRHNFFCQVRGKKFVRLVNPVHRDKLYLFDDFMRKNTSQVDVENPNFEEFPEFLSTVCEDFLMEDGDCLFIPKGYFHHVRSLTESISVSIWFGKSE